MILFRCCSMQRMEMVSIFEIPETQLTSMFHTDSNSEWMLTLKHHEYYNARLDLCTGEFEVSIILGYSAASLNVWCPMSCDIMMVSPSTVQTSNEETAWEYSTIKRNTTMLNENVGHQSPTMWHRIPVQWRPEISQCEWVRERFIGRQANKEVISKKYIPAWVMNSMEDDYIYSYECF